MLTTPLASVYQLVCFSEGIGLIAIATATGLSFNEVCDQLIELAKAGKVQERHGFWYPRFAPGDRFVVRLSANAIEIQAGAIPCYSFATNPDTEANPDTLVYAFFDVACSVARQMASSLQLPLLLV